LGFEKRIEDRRVAMYILLMHVPATLHEIDKDVEVVLKCREMQGCLTEKIGHACIDPRFCKKKPCVSVGDRARQH
jgi:hypothetical protein